jgi:hypothetical protein
MKTGRGRVKKYLLTPYGVGRGCFQGRVIHEKSLVDFTSTKIFLS